MRITSKQLSQIIQEELERLTEDLNVSFDRSAAIANTIDIMSKLNDFSLPVRNAVAREVGIKIDEISNSMAGLLGIIEIYMGLSSERREIKRPGLAKQMTQDYIGFATATLGSTLSMGTRGPKLALDALSGGLTSYSQFAADAAQFIELMEDAVVQIAKIAQVTQLHRAGFNEIFENYLKSLD